MGIGPSWYMFEMFDIRRSKVGLNEKKTKKIIDMIKFFFIINTYSGCHLILSSNITAIKRICFKYFTLLKKLKTIYSVK